MVDQQNHAQYKRQDDVSDDLICRCADLKCALKLQFEVAGLGLKEAAYQLGPQLDEKSLSRMLSFNPNDHRNFPPELIDASMDICGNEIALRWQAQKRGYGLVRLKSALELENEQLRAELERERQNLEIIKGFVRDVKGVCR